MANQFTVITAADLLDINSPHDKIYPNVPVGSLCSATSDNHKTINNQDYIEVDIALKESKQGYFPLKCLGNLITCKPIVDLHILTVTNDSQLFTNDAFQYIPIDLNMDAGGEFVYIGYKRAEGAEDAITSITFGAYSDQQDKLPVDPALTGYKMYPDDLNKEAGGSYIYMFSSTDKKKKPILGITIGITRDSASPPNLGSKWQIANDGVDLNKGAGGKYIWVYTTTDLS